MRKIAFIAVAIIVFSVVSSCATTPQAVGTEMIVQKAIEVQGTKEKLYRASNEWVIKYFAESRMRIQYQDKEEGVIIGQGEFEERFNSVLFYINYTMTIETKENKVRITIKDVYGELAFDRSMKTKSEEMIQQNYDKTKMRFTAMIDEFSAYMKQDKEEW